MITFAIPCYKSNIDYLRVALQSVVVQTSNQWALHLVDGNTQPDQRLIDLVDEFKTQYKQNKIQYLYNVKDRSMAGNWNYAIETATSDLVVLLHDDDKLDSNYVAQMLTLSEQYKKSAAFFCGVDLIDENNRKKVSFADKIKSYIEPKGPIVLLQKDPGLSALLKGCFIFCPSVCYRKSMLPKGGFSATWKMVTDLDMYSRILQNGKAIVGTKDVLFHYRRHNENQTAKLTNNFIRFDEECAFYNELHIQLNPSKWPLSRKETKKKRIIKLHLLFLALLNFVKFRFKKSFSHFCYLIKNVE